jgi:hypothetical protein
MTTSDAAVSELAVDRGQPIIVIATFADGDPDSCYFSFTQPGSERPHVDDGYGQAKSRIVRLSRGVYRYTFSTRDFEHGQGGWSFLGEWDEPLPDGHDEVVIRGKYRVRESERQLP